MGIIENAVTSKAVVLSDVNVINNNILFGAVVVLAVLILIALIILGNIMSVLKKGTDKTNDSSADNAITRIQSNDQMELAGNSELVAVITAAICASMGEGTSPDGFVVRSIRRAR